MKRLFGFGMIVAIALASCQSGLKNQIMGKWQLVEPKRETLTCISEFTDKYYLSECRMTPEFLEKYGGSGYISKSTVDFELDGDRIVFMTGNGNKTSSKIKVEDDVLYIGEDKDGWAKYKKVK